MSCHARALALTITTHQSSHSSLPSPLFGPSPIRRLWSLFVVLSLLRTPANECVRLQERLKRHFLTRRAHSPPSPLGPPANSEPTKSTPDRKVRVGKERNRDVDLLDVSPMSLLVAHWHLNTMGYQRSANMTPGTAEQHKTTRRTCWRRDPSA